MHDRLAHALDRTRRHPSSLAAVYLDLDRFKVINDSLGHDMGDQVLTTVAERLQSALRPQDTIARLGGDEFAVLLPEAGPEAARGALHKMQERLDRAMHEGRWPVSFSIGAVTLCESPDSVDACLERADRIMYAVKNSGKNRVKLEVVGEPVSGARA